MIIRAYRSYMEKVLMTLAYVHYGFHHKLFNVVDFCSNQFGRRMPANGNAELVSNEDTRIRGVIYNALKTNQELEEPSLYDMIMELSAILGQSGKQDGFPETDFLDALVKVLGDRWGRNLIHYDTFQKVQKAILMPEELASLTAALRNDPPKCFSCGHVFMNGEVATFVREGRDIPPAMACIKCVQPSVVVCSTCNNSSVQMDRGMVKVLKRVVKCSECQMNEKVVQAPPPQDLFVRPLAFEEEVARMRNVLRRPNRANVPIVARQWGAGWVEAPANNAPPGAPAPIEDRVFVQDVQGDLGPEEQ